MAIQLFSPGRVVITFNLQRKLAKVIPYSWEEEVQRIPPVGLGVSA